MTMTRTGWLALVSVLLLSLTACGDDDEGSASPDTGIIDRNDTAGDDTTAPDASGEDDAAGDDVAEDDTTDDDAIDDGTDDGTDPGPDDDAGELGPGECRTQGDCPSRFTCDEGVCRRLCASAVDCNDENACTEDICNERGLCDYVPVDAPLSDPVEGDCRRPACVDGEIQEVANPTDLPPDDGIICTRATCVGQFPQYYADHALCDDGDDLNGFETCSVEERGCVTGANPPWVCEDFDPGWVRDEICGDGQDNNNNGLVDEDCPCSFGEAQRCYTGPPNTREVGGCLDGIQQCIDRENPRWGECVGAILPSEEVCDAKDNSCNGCVDDIEDCVPLLRCPSEDLARPLRWYPLDATAIFGGLGSEYTWTVVAPPNSATRTVENPTAGVTRVYLDVSGDYQITLQLRDDKGDLYGCSWVIRATGLGLRVEMRWDTFGQVDMDLHMNRGRGTFCSADDCYYANCRVSGSVSWGYAASPATECDSFFGSCPNPRLDIDNISGFDPENINLDNPRDGDRFRVMAHMFSGSRTTNPVVSIYCGGVLKGVFGEAPDQVGLTQSGGSCGGQTWRVADVFMNVNESTGATDCDVDVLTNASGDWDVRTGTNAF